MNSAIMVNSVSLALYAGLSLNLLLQMGINLRDFSQETRRSWKLILAQGMILTFSVMLLWLFFTYALTPLSLGYLEYFFVFPLTAALFKGLAWTYRFLFRSPPPEGETPADQFSAQAGNPVPPEGPPQGGTVLERSMATILAALFFTQRLAGNPLDALILSAAFSLGIFLAESLIKNIHQRISLERLPPVLRGLPLLLLSMGFLALISEAVFLTLLG